MKTLFNAGIAFVLGCASGLAATTATDNASNSAYSDGWTTGDNGGSGFGSWTLSSSNGGSYIGSTGQGDPSFGLYANSDPGNYSTASRSFTGGALTSGQTFSIDLGHTANITTNKDLGINLTDGGSVVFTLKFVGGATNWVLDDGGGGTFGSGQNYAPNTSLTFSFTYEGGNNYSYTFGTGSGTNYTATNDISGIDGIELFNTGQGSGENFGFNNLTIVPEPSIALLGGLGLLCLLRRRR